MSSATTGRRGAGAAANERATGEGGRRNTNDELRRVVAQSLNVGNPANNAKALPDMADPKCEYQLELVVDEIRPYDRNPRRAANARFDEIKESIRVSGIRNPLTVTRRPGEHHFIIEAGGNTRLLAIQELWAETRDARFQKLMAVFRPWRSESHVLTAHLIENEQRGEMTFWDKACGVLSLKVQLEAEKGRTLTLRQLEDELRSIGMSVNIATLAHYLFAIERLRILGEADTGLSGLDVKTIQPRLNLLKRYAQMRTALPETALYATVFEPAFKRCVDEYRQTQVFRATAVCEACEEALAQHLDEPVMQLRMMLDTLAQPSSASLGTLSAAASGPQPVLPTEPASTIGSHAPQRPKAVRTDSTGVGGSATALDSKDFTLRSRAENAAALEPLTAQVRLFATLAGIGDCLRLDAKAPCGYVMQALSVPADLDSQHSLKHRAWGLLALISGQIHDGAWVSLSENRREAHSEAYAEAKRGESKSPSLFVIDNDFLHWLLDAQDEAAGAFCRVVAMVRDLPVAAPKIRATTAAIPQPGTK